MGAEPQLALERYAAITALIDAGEERDAVVERAGLAKEAWQQAQLSWLKRLASEARRDKRVLLDAFNELLVGYLRLVEEGEEEQLWPVALGTETVAGLPRPELPSVVAAAQGGGGLEVTAEPNSEASPAPSAALPFVAAPASVQVPASVGAPPASVGAPPVSVASPASVPRPPASVGSAAMSGASPPASVPSPTSVRTVPASARSPYPASVRTPPPISVQLAPPSSRAPHERTLDAEDGLGAGSAALPFQAAPDSVRHAPPTSQRAGGLPFVSAAPQPAPASVAQPAPAPPSRHARTEPPPVGSRGALPFEPPAPTSTTLDVPDQGGIRGTVGVDGLSLGEVLPFDSGVQPATKGALPFEGSSTRADQRRAEQREAASNVAALPFQAQPKPSGALPFRAAPAPAPESKPDPIAETVEQGPAREALTGTVLGDVSPLALNHEPKLTLEQFASITAEIGVNPDQRPAIRQRYGLDQAAHEQEQLAWAGKLMRDPELNELYAAKVREYRNYLERSGGSG